MGDELPERVALASRLRTVASALSSTTIAALRSPRWGRGFSQFFREYRGFVACNFG
jgi:hypothetical protein